MIEKIAKLLPGANCNQCGYPRCELFAEALQSNTASLDACSLLEQERFKANLDQIRSLLAKRKKTKPAGYHYIGLIDQYRADNILHPLKGESACREMLISFSNIPVKPGNIVRYRPLGCPIMHIAKVLSSELGLITVHVTGPRRKEQAFDQTINLGVCLVAGFCGILEGNSCQVGDTIRFIPGLCMMQKVHSGIVVQVKNEELTLELIDLKVWEPPVKYPDHRLVKQPGNQAPTKV